MATGSRTPTDRTSTAPDRGGTGARSAGTGGDGRKKRGGWLWWALGLLALLLLAALLLGLFSGDDDKKKPATQTTQPTPEPAGGTAAQSGAGTLTARDTSLLPVPAGGLAEFETETATGTGVTVQSVVKDEGFWVGSSAQDRVYVEYGGDVGADEAQGFTPKVGDKVDLTGEMRPAPEDPAQTLNLTSSEDAQLVSEQGAYVNADTATIAQ